eukprot:scaffold46615_cov63-Phaeocystis_antarctica.AAC.2
MGAQRASPVKVARRCDFIEYWATSYCTPTSSMQSTSAARRACARLWLGLGVLRKVQLWVPCAVAEVPDTRVLVGPNGRVAEVGTAGGERAHDPCARE